MRHVLTYNEQSLLDLAHTDHDKFREVVRTMIRSLPTGEASTLVDPGSCSISSEEPQSVQPSTSPTCRNSFRPLNDNEFNILIVKGGIVHCLSDRGTFLSSFYWNNLRISYEELSGGFTVCLLVLPSCVLDASTSTTTSFLWRGVSRCSYHDRPNRIKGQALAFIRVILESRPVEV